MNLTELLAKLDAPIVIRPTRCMTQGELETYLDKAADILSGNADHSEFRGYVFALLFYKRISDCYEEEVRTGRRQLSWPPCCLTKECYSSGCCRSGCLFESSIVEGCGHVVEGGGGGQRSRAAARCPRSPPVRRRRIVHMSMACRARSARPPVGAKFSLSCGFRLQPASHQARAGDPEPCLSLARRARP